MLARETEYNRDGTAKVERDPSDPGGTTKYGIDQRSHPHVDVASLTKTEAAQIYHDTEWTRARCGELKAPWDLAVFDSAINPGLGWCIPNLQRTVGAVPDAVAPTNIAVHRIGVIRPAIDVDRVAVRRLIVIVPVGVFNPDMTQRRAVDITLHASR